MTNKQRISEYGPDFFEQIFDTDLDGVGSVRVHIVYEVASNDTIHVAEYVLFVQNRERSFSNLPYSAQLQLLADVAHESAKHISFYKQDMIDFEAWASRERRAMSAVEAHNGR